MTQEQDNMLVYDNIITQVEKPANDVNIVPLLEAIENSLKAKDDPRIFQSRLKKRPAAGTYYRDGGRLVASADDLLEVLSHTPQVEEETGYCGPDHEKVAVYRVALPSGGDGDLWYNRVPYVKAVHIPYEYFWARKEHTGPAVEVLARVNKDDVNLQLICRALYPVYSDRSLFNIISKETMINEYHHITIKLDRATRKFHSWFPGVDKHRQPCQTLENQYVLLGPDLETHLKQKGK
jgi:hypothetical protein